MTISELKACPFCGSRNVAQGASADRISVWCFCGARGPDVPFPENCDPVPPIQKCHEAWNRRASLPTEPGQVGEPLDDAELTARLKELAVEVFPSANKFAVADGVKRILSVLERVTPTEYAVLHSSLFPSRSALIADDGQPNEAQEWHDYDPDC